ncbi:hypothetical protein F4782DRAFT_277636 [Xylaria castorea]|nr:hypothetical protein F4782DRAFT_277636 [Xylaria castorea]
MLIAREHLPKPSLFSDWTASKRVRVCNHPSFRTAISVKSHGPETFGHRILDGPLVLCFQSSIRNGVHYSFIRNPHRLLRIDLHEAAWTGTLMSFIQEPVSRIPAGTTSISRADECRFMYLS